jgi:hypothetical protein
MISDDLESDGIFYPKTKPMSREGHPSLAWDILEQIGRPVARLSKSRVNWEEALAGAQKSSAHTLLISSEDFAIRYFDERAALALRGILGEVTTVVIFGVRNPISAVPSIWQQSVKWGCGFGEELLDIDDAVSLIANRNEVQIVPYIERLKSALRCEARYFVVPAEPNSDVLLTRFAQAADLSVDVTRKLRSISTASNSNRGMSYLELRMLLKLNRILAKLSPEQTYYPYNGSEERLVARELVLQSLPKLPGINIPLSQKALDELRVLRDRVSMWIGRESCVIGSVDELFVRSNLEGERNCDDGVSLTEEIIQTLMCSIKLQTDAYLKLREYCLEVEAARDWWRGTSDNWERAARGIASDLSP